VTARLGDWAGSFLWKARTLKMTEAQLTAKLKKLVESMGGWYLKIHGGFMQKGGVPDVFISIPAKNEYETDGWMGWVELKVERNKCSALQKYQIGKMIAAGCKVLVLTAMDDGSFMVEDGNRIHKLEELKEVFEV
jgi:hypothetical protein